MSRRKSRADIGAVQSRLLTITAGLSPSKSRNGSHLLAGCAPTHSAVCSLVLSTRSAVGRGSPISPVDPPTRQMHPVPGPLQVAQHDQLHEVAEVQLRRRRVEAAVRRDRARRRVPCAARTRRWSAPPALATAARRGCRSRSVLLRRASIRAGTAWIRCPAGCTACPMRRGCALRRGFAGTVRRDASAPRRARTATGMPRVAAGSGSPPPAGPCAPASAPAAGGARNSDRAAAARSASSPPSLPGQAQRPAPAGPGPAPSPARRCRPGAPPRPRGRPPPPRPAAAPRWRSPSGPQTTLAHQCIP